MKGAQDNQPQARLPRPGVTALTMDLEVVSRLLNPISTIEKERNSRNR